MISTTFSSLKILTKKNINFINMHENNEIKFETRSDTEAMHLQLSK